MDLSLTRTFREGTFDPESEIVVEPSQGWRKVNLSELWAYRELFWVLAARDIKVRYKQTLLGATWTVVQPVLTMLVFTLVFGYFAALPSDGYPYPLFVYSGLLMWNFFSGALTSSSGSLVSSSSLVGKVYFPRLIIPLASVGAALVNLAISGTILMGLIVYYKIGWTTQFLLVPLLVLAAALTALGMGSFLAALNVAYRDAGNLLPFLLQLWFFLTPVVYPQSAVPSQWKWLFHLNPMTGLVGGSRAAFLGQPFDSTSVAVSLVISAAIFFGGVQYFQRVERTFAEII